MVLTLTENEEIIIGDNVKIMIVRIKGQQVKFGINTPYKISVFRDDAKEVLRPVKPLEG
jgi:carbon storage regulator